MSVTHLQQGSDPVGAPAHVHGSLQALVQDLQSPSTKDKKKSMEAVLQLLADLVDRGVCPCEFLGLHVCCNLLVLVIQHFVTPALFKSKPSSLATPRLDVARPLQRLLELLHHEVPVDFCHQPLVWKDAKPLHHLLKHMAEVLESQVQGEACAQEYSAMVSWLMRIKVYRDSIARRTLESLVTSLVQMLLTSASVSNVDGLSESALESVAAGISSLTSCEHFFSSLRKPHELMQSLVEVCAARHKNVILSSSLKCEMHLIVGIRRFAEQCQFDDRVCATLPWRLSVVCMQCWHSSTRRDGWRMEALNLSSQQLALSFSEILSSRVAHEAHRLLSASGNHMQRKPHSGASEASGVLGMAGTSSDGFRGSAVSGGNEEEVLADGGGGFAAAATFLPQGLAQLTECPTTLYPAVEALHSIFLPVVLSILSAPKFELTIVASRELSHAPCPPMAPLFELCALVLHLAHETFRWRQRSRRGNNEAADATSGGVHDRGDPPAAKRARTAASPLDDVIAHLEAPLQTYAGNGGAAASDAVTTFMNRSDAVCVWLHTLAVPVATMAYSEKECSRLTSTLMRFVVGGSLLEQPLVHALRSVAPRASLSSQMTVYSWALAKFMPMSGVESDDGPPSPLGYDLLCRLSEQGLLLRIDDYLVRTGLQDATTSSVFSPAADTATEEAGGSGAQAAATSAELSRILAPVDDEMPTHVKSFHLTMDASAKHCCLPLHRFLTYHAALTLCADRAPIEALTEQRVIQYVLMSLGSNALRGPESMNEALALLEVVSGVLLCRKTMSLQRQGVVSSRLVTFMVESLSGIRDFVTAQRACRLTELPPTVEQACRPETVLLEGAPSASQPRGLLGGTPLQLPALPDSISLLDGGGETAADLQWYGNAANAVADRISSLAFPAVIKATAEHMEMRSYVATLCSQAIRSILKLRRCGHWNRAAADRDGVRCAELLVHGRPDKQTLVSQLTPVGGVLHNVQCLLGLLANQMASSPTLLHEADVLDAVANLMDDCGAELCSVEIGLWEPEQKIVSTLGTIGRRLLESGIGPLLDLSSPSGTATSTTPTDGATVPYAGAATLQPAGGARQRAVATTTIADSVSHLARALRRFFVVMRTADISLVCTDPLITAQLALQRIAPVLSGQRLLLAVEEGATATTGGQPMSAPPVFLSALLVQVAQDLVTVLTVLDSDDARNLALRAIRTLSTRHIHSHLQAVATLLGSFGSSESPAWSVHFRAQIGTAAEEFVQRILANDADRCSGSGHSGSAAVIAHSPPLSPRAEVALVRCLAQLIARCDAVQAERLSKIFFKFVAEQSPFEVREAVAKDVCIPFRVFSRIAKVFVELQHRVKDAVLARERGTCATALLALCNASASASQLEPDITSFLLELYATRDFLHRPLIVRALHRMARSTAPLACEWRSITATTSMTTTTTTARRLSSSVSFVDLTRRHMARLLFDWMWRFRHNLEALPALCFGYHSVAEMARDYLPAMLPFALLHVQRDAGQWSSENPTTTLFQMFCSNGDAVPLLRAHFVQVVSVLVLLQHHSSSSSSIAAGQFVPAASGATLRSTTSQAELSEAATFALEWMAVQLGRGTFSDLCRRHMESIVVALLPHIGCGSGSTLLDSSNPSSASDKDAAMEPLPDRSVLVAGAQPHGSDATVLPSVSFAVATKALTTLCKWVECPSIRSFFGPFHGDRGTFVLWNLLFRFQTAESALSQCDVVLQIRDVVHGWLAPLLPLHAHLFESAVVVLCHVLHSNGSTIPSPSCRRVICDTLRTVWLAAAGSSEARDDSVLRKVRTLLSTTLLPLRAQHADCDRLWKDLVGRDSHLQRADWKSQQSQLHRAYSQSQQHLAESGRASSVAASSAHRSTAKATVDPAQRRFLVSLVTAIEDVSYVGGADASSFYDELSAALEGAQAQLVEAVEQEQCDVDSAKFTKTLQASMSHLRAVTGNAVLSVGTRYAALNALRVLSSVYARLAALSAANNPQQHWGACGHTANDKGGTFLAEQAWMSAGAVTDAHDALDQQVLGDGKRESLLPRWYAEVLQQVAALRDFHDASVALEATLCLRHVACSTHDIVVAAMGLTVDDAVRPSLRKCAEMYAREAADDFPVDLRAAAANAAVRGGGTYGRAPSFGTTAPLLDHTHVWALLPYQPGAFLAAFVHAAAAQYQLCSKFPFLKSLLALIQAHTPFAEHVLPVILLHMALQTPESETLRRLRREWTALLQKHVFACAATLKPLTRTFLSALNSVRIAFTSTTRVLGRRHRSGGGGGGGAGKPSRDPRHAAGADALHLSAGMVDDVSQLWWLNDISPLALATAALECDQHFLAYMLIEWSCEGLLSGQSGLTSLTRVKRSTTGDCGLLPVVPVSLRNDGAARTLRDAARAASHAQTIHHRLAEVTPSIIRIANAIFDTDLVHACSQVPSAEPRSGIELSRSVALGKWLTALQQVSTTIRSDDPERVPDGAGTDVEVEQVATYLLQLGCSGVALRWATNARGSVSCGAAAAPSRLCAALRSATAEAAWRTSSWHAVTAIHNTSQNSLVPQSFHEALLHALRSVAQKDRAGLKTSVRGAQRFAVDLLLTHQPLCAPVALIHCQILSEISRFGDRVLVDPLASAAASTGPTENTAGRWYREVSASASGSDSSLLHHYRHGGVEVRDAVRAVLLQTARDYHSWAKHVVEATDRAFDAGELDVAAQSLRTFLRSVQQDPTASGALFAQMPSIVLQQAKLLWHQRDAGGAVRLLQETVCPDLKSHADVVMHAVEWAHEAQLAPTTALVQDKAFHVVTGAQESGGRASFLMARLCDEIMREQHRRWNSEEAVLIRQTVEQSKATHAHITRQIAEMHASQLSASAARGDRDKTVPSGAVKILEIRRSHIQKEIDMFNAENAVMLKDWSQYRDTAIHHYARCLQSQCTGRAAVHAVFRLAHLWLAPPPHITVLPYEDAKCIKSVPTMCYLPIFPQLVARLDDRADSPLGDLIVSVARDFPFHALWPILAILHGDRLSNATEAETYTVDWKKVDGARRIVERLTALSPGLKSIVLSTVELAGAYLELASEDRKDHLPKFPIKPQMKLLLSSTSFQRLPPPTIALHADPTIAARGYQLPAEVPTIVQYAAHYEIPSGINRPKILSCVLSNGDAHRQLLKSKDDTRQDAVLEQLFSLVNFLLSHDPSTRKRRLSMRTYQVVPLAPTSGIIQWVLWTLPFSEYLVGSEESPGAHTRYFPDEPHSTAIRAEYPTMRTKNMHEKMLEYRLPKYQEVTAKFTPAMHYFFLEHFASPRQWFERKREYSNSVAVASMVGYLVGLGDRHLSNILLDTRTAEVIMIDLGIAFDQGKLLAVPERVPFRLTRDVVDGMGCLGVEGWFRHSSEATLRLTRQHKDLLWTVLETFIHDPLAKWGISMQQLDADDGGRVAKSRQNAADANRAVARIGEKLCGYESSEVFSVEGHVQRLIQMATAEENLAMMFEGWAPWV